MGILLSINIILHTSCSNRCNRTTQIIPWWWRIHTTKEAKHINQVFHTKITLVQKMPSNLISIVISLGSSSLSRMNSWKIWSSKSRCTSKCSIKSSFSRDPRKPITLMSLSRTIVLPGSMQLKNLSWRIRSSTELTAYSTISKWRRSRP